MKSVVGVVKDVVLDVKVEVFGFGLLKLFGSKVDVVKGNVVFMVEDVKSIVGGVVFNVFG